MKLYLSVLCGRHQITYSGLTGCPPLPDLHRISIDQHELLFTDDYEEAKLWFRHLQARFTPKPEPAAPSCCDPNPEVILRK
jgi:hypothetical protein